MVTSFEACSQHNHQVDGNGGGSTRGRRHLRLRDHHFAAADSGQPGERVGIPERRLRRRRAPVCWFGAIASLVLLTVGCGGQSEGAKVASIRTSSSASGSRSPRRPQTGAAAALAASRCMRSRGIRTFPDPINGHFGFSFKSGVNPDTSQFKAAYSYCGARYLGVGTRSTPAQRAQWNAAAMKYSACMRSHEVSDFPDPDGTGAIHLPTPNYSRSPKVLHAEGACRRLFVGEGIVFVSPIA
jgi:hypothetical protein